VTAEIIAEPADALRLLWRRRATASAARCTSRRMAGSRAYAQLGRVPRGVRTWVHPGADRLVSYLNAALVQQHLHVAEAERGPRGSVPSRQHGCRGYRRQADGNSSSSAPWPFALTEAHPVLSGETCLARRSGFVVRSATGGSIRRARASMAPISSRATATVSRLGPGAVRTLTSHGGDGHHTTTPRAASTRDRHPGGSGAVRSAPQPRSSRGHPQVATTRHCRRLDPNGLDRAHVARRTCLQAIVRGISVTCGGRGSGHECKRCTRRRGRDRRGHCHRAHERRDGVAGTAGLMGRQPPELIADAALTAAGALGVRVERRRWPSPPSPTSASHGDGGTLRGSPAAAPATYPPVLNGIGFGLAVWRSAIGGGCGPRDHAAPSATVGRRRR
jgi:hypothetical protein